MLATKGRHKMGDGPNDWGASRLHMRQALDASLQRLATDYIDLYYVHAPDYDTPIDETLRFLDDAVRQGKILYPACSNFRAWRVCEALWTSDKLGLARFAAVQPLYNLVNRDIEVELLPLCQEHGLGVVSYSPLARGILTGKYKPGEAFPEGSRAVTQRQAAARSGAARREPGTSRSSWPPTARRRAARPRSSPWPGAWPIRSSRRSSSARGRWSNSTTTSPRSSVKITPDDEAFVDSLVPPGEHSGKGFNDPLYPVTGRTKTL